MGETMTYKVVASNGTNKSFSNGLMARELATRLHKEGHAVMFSRYQAGHGWIPLAV